MRKNNGKGILFTVLGFILGFIIALFVRSILPPSMEKLSGLIFFGIILFIGGAVTFITGRFTRR